MLKKKIKKLFALDRLLLIPTLLAAVIVTASGLKNRQSSTGRATQYDLNQGRILKVAFENEVKDESVIDQNITVNGAINYQRGTKGKGIIFNDNQGSITATAVGLANDFSLSIWLKGNYQGHTNLFSLIKDGQKIELVQSGERFYTLKVNDQTVKVANNLSFAWAKSYGNGRLFNLTLTYNSSSQTDKCKLYLDGENDFKYGFGAFPCTFTDLSASNVTFGKDTKPAFSGLIDEVALWNRVLSVEEIQQYMGETYDHYGDGVCEPQENSLNSPVDCKDNTGLTGKIRDRDTDQYYVWWADPLIRTWANRPLPTNIVDSADLKLAKNETRITQIVLTGKTDRTIPVSNISLDLANTPFSGQVYLLESIPVVKGSDNYNQPVHPKNLDPLPDAAVPLASYQATMDKTTLDITSGQHKTIIVEIKTTSTTPAGNYPVYLIIDGRRIPVAVQVYNFTLPDRPTIPTLYSADGLQAKLSDPFGLPRLHGFSEANYSSKTDRQRLIDTYLDAYVDHNIGPYHAGENAYFPNSFFTWFDCNANTLKPDVKTKMTERLTKYLDQQNIAVTELNHLTQYWYAENNLRICGLNIDSYDQATFNLTDYSQYQTTPGYREKLRANFTDLANFLRSKGWLDRVYFIFDEPFNNCGISEYICIFRARAFHDILAPLGFKVGPILPAPKYFDTVQGNGIVEQDDWFNFLSTSENGLAERAGTGEFYTGNADNPEYWWYHTKHQAFNADFEANEPVSLFWQLFQYDIKGSLQWAFIGWDNASTNPWNPWEKMRYRWGGNGGINLFYPPCYSSQNNQPCSSATYRVVSSIRLKLLREGIGDHAYLTLLAQKQGREKVLNDLNFHGLFDENRSWNTKTLLLKNSREQAVARILDDDEEPTPTNTPTPTVTPTTVLPTSTPTSTPTPTVVIPPTITIPPVFSVTLNKGIGGNILLDGSLSEYVNISPFAAFADTKVKGFWNDNGIYLGVEINDNQLTAANDPSLPACQRGSGSEILCTVWTDDSVEWFVDVLGDNGGGSARNKQYMKADDFQGIVNINNALIDLQGNNTTFKPTFAFNGNYTSAVTREGNKTFIELFVPFSSLASQEADIAGRVIKLGLARNDLDGTNRTSEIWGRLGASFQNAANWQYVLVSNDTVSLPLPPTPTSPLPPDTALNIARASGEIVVDGNLTEYASVEPVLFSSAKVYPMWNSQGLYLGYDVTDNILEVVNSPFTCGDIPERDCTVWNDDAVEWFIDSKNNRGGANNRDKSFMRADDYQGIVNLANARVDLRGQFLINRPSFSWDGEWQSETAIDFTNYTAEVFIPWETIRITSVQAGYKFGLGLAVFDRDFDEVSSTLWGNLGLSHQNASNWVEVKLAE